MFCLMPLMHSNAADHFIMVLTYHGSSCCIADFIADFSAGSTDKNYFTKRLV